MESALRRGGPRRRAHELRGAKARYLQAGGAVAASTPAQSLSLVIQPASMTRLRLSLVSGCGAMMIELTWFLPGVVNGAVPLTLSTVVPLQSWTAASPAALPSSRASFQTSIVWLPSATLLRAAASPS